MGFAWPDACAGVAFSPALALSGCARSAFGVQLSLCVCGVAVHSCCPPPFSDSAVFSEGGASDTRHTYGPARAVPAGPCIPLSCSRHVVGVGGRCLSTSGSRSEPVRLPRPALEWNLQGSGQVGCVSRPAREAAKHCPPACSLPPSCIRGGVCRGACRTRHGELLADVRCSEPACRSQACVAPRLFATLRRKRAQGSIAPARCVEAG